MTTHTPGPKYRRYTMRNVLTDVQMGRHPTIRTPNAIRGVVRALEAGWIGVEMQTDKYYLTAEGESYLASLGGAR